MICKDCGRVDGLKILIRDKVILCKQCEYNRNKKEGCQHARVKIYKDFADGTYYSICKLCGYRQEK